MRSMRYKLRKPSIFLPNILWSLLDLRYHSARNIKYSSQYRIRGLSKKSLKHHSNLAYNCLVFESTRKSEVLSALTNFWAWFMIWTIKVSILIISWKIDFTTVNKKSFTNFWWWTLNKYLNNPNRLFEKRLYRVMIKDWWIDLLWPHFESWWLVKPTRG